MKIRRTSTAASFSWIASGVFAFFLSSNSVAENLATLSLGPAWYRSGNTQTFDVQPEVANTYQAMLQTRTLGTSTFFLGRQQALNADLLGQLGLAVSTSTHATSKGEIWQTADAQFNNFAYQYRVAHTHLALKAKLLSTLFSQKWTPYLSGSVGAARNHAYSYQTKSYIYEAVPAPEFQNETQTAFTYTAGLGVQVLMDTHWALGLGYEFADWGQSALSRASGQTINTGLALNHLYTYALEFNLSYFIV